MNTSSKIETTSEQTNEEPEMQAEYDFSGGQRGRYAARYAQGTNLIALAPDVAEAFPDSESVNEALRGLVTLARRSVKLEPVGS